MNKKRILVIFTGGTIAMVNDLNTMKTVMSSGNNNIMQVITSTFTDLEIDYIEHSYLPSPYITPNHMFKLAKLIESKLLTENYEGVVVTHGTDTIEETAYFLDCYFNVKSPIVFTGSMRNLSELGYDGLSNVVSSILVAAHNDSKDRGVLLVLNDEINAASEVIKSHTVALDTFKSLEFGPLGIVDSRDVIYHRMNIYTKHNITISKLTKRVEIVKVTSGTDSLLIDFLIESKIDGIVLEALGRGNVPPLMLPGIIRALENNIPIILTSRCPKGRVLDTYAYEGGGHHLKQLGVLFSGNLPSHKARLLLMMALDFISNKDELKHYFDH